ncbi:MAG: 2-C-methyl-D-erythritol 4-phosphate cytidylyltransferase [Bacteroidota bacterium]
MAAKKNVIVVAGGSGKRMQSRLPKQFLPLSGKPVLMRTLEIFYQTIKKEAFQVFLVLPESHIAKWEELCLQHHFNIPHQIVNGGTERFYSVKNALDKIKDDSLVAIHDGVRPLVSKAVINRCFDMAERFGSAIPVISVAESMRKIEQPRSIIVNRSEYVLVQTPQVFRSKLIKSAYQTAFDEKFTDDASVVENYGESINLVEGSRENIKITLPSDLSYAEWLISEMKAK